jgi:hypothetical protein
VFLFSETSSLTDLITSIVQRVGDDIDRKNLPQILVLIKIVPLFYNHIMFLKSKFCSFPDTISQYEDEDHDKVILSSDSDLMAAVDHARQIGWKVNALFLK